MMEKEIEELANEISLETDDVPLSRTSGIEKAFYIQMATNLIKKGYSRNQSAQLVPLQEQKLIEDGKT